MILRNNGVIWMKKEISLLLAGALLLSLGACGTKTAEPGTPAPAPSAAETKNVSQAAEETVTAPTPEPAAPTPEGTVVSTLPAAENTPEPVAAPEPAAATEEPVESAEAEEEGTPIPAFTTTDLAGNTVTEAIFAEKDLTVVNVWGTFCGPCISEMPELGAWAREMPENVQLIGVVCDLMEADGENETHDLAASILEGAEADFTCLTVSDGLMWIPYSVSGVPTTFFVNSSGNIVGKAILGAYVELYKAQVEELLNGNEG